MSQAAKPISKPIDTSENQQCGHRKIAFSVEPGDKLFHLKMQDSRHTWNFIPLGTVPSVAKGKHPKGANELVPVIPLCYTTPDCDPQKAELLRPGWLYVFWEGRLWRELEVEKNGYLRDVNLEHNQKKESRQATGTFDNRILLPYHVAGKDQLIEMAYSEVQWSWARINKLQEDATLRRQRMQQIDLSGSNAKFPTMPANGTKARIENVSKAPNFYALTLQRQSNIPVVYLQDPIGVANTLAAAHETDWAEMEMLIESLRCGIRPSVLEKRAKLGDRAPQASPEEEKTGKQIAAQFEVAVLMQQIGFASEKNQKAYGKHLNQGHLDVLLGKQEREQQRRKILDSKLRLAEHLGTASYQMALEDYLDNIAGRVIEGKGVVLYHARFLDRPAIALDAHLNRPGLNPPSSPDAGMAYIDRLKNEGNTASLILAKLAEVGRGERSLAGSATATSVQVLHNPAAPLGQRLRVVIEDKNVDLAAKAGTIGAALVETFAGRTTLESQSLDWLAQRINTMKVPGFPEFAVAEQTFPDLEIPEGYRPVDGGTSFSLRETTMVGTLAMPQAATVVYPSPGKFRAVVSGRTLRILPVEFKRIDVVARQIIAKPVPTQVANIATRFQSSIARAGVTKPLFLALELVNLNSAWQQVLNDSKNLGSFGIKGINLAGAAGSAAEQLAELSNLWMRIVGKEESGTFLRIARTGKFVGNAAAGAVNSWESFSNFSENDQDASLAYGIGALAAIGALTVTGLGWTILFASAGIGSVIAGSLLEDDPLERFAKNGPFGQNPPGGNDIWEQIQTGSRSVRVTDHFAKEWPNWATIRKAVTDDYLYAFQTDITTRREKVRLPAKDLDGDGQLGLIDKATAFMINSMTEYSRTTSIQVKITLPPFAPFLSDLDFQCCYYPRGYTGPKILLLKPAEIEHTMDEDSAKVKTVLLHYRLDEEQVRQQTTIAEFLFACRIQSSKHAAGYYPASAANGEFRYLAVRRGAMGMNGNEVTAQIRKIGTLLELDRKDFWEHQA